MKKIKNTAFIVGASLAASLGSVSSVMAAENPFALSELASGYMNMAEAESTVKMKDGACGEGKCGGKMAAATEKAVEGKCGAGKK